MEPDHRDHRCHRPSAFDKMERVVREMQDTEHGGVPVRAQKLFLTSIPAAFMGYDLIEWVMERFGIEESEALNLSNQLCNYGYFFPISDSKNLVVKDDSSLYRFQSPYYWPWQNRPPDNVEYAIYLAKRTLRNKQRHGLEDYELEALSNLRKNLANKWDFVTMQAEEQIRLMKQLKKSDKLVSDSQERAYWRVHRPPPGYVTAMEQCPVPGRRNGVRPRRRTVEDARREVEVLRNCLARTRVKVSLALEGMVQHVETYAEYDAMVAVIQPNNPWVSEDVLFWQLNSPLVEIPTEKRVKRWALSMEELVSDPTGLQKFTNFLRTEYSHENIRFWSAVNDLRRSAQSQILRKVHEIFEEFLAPGAPCEINIDGKTMERVHHEMKTPTRFTFDAAQEHVYTLLLKKDCYPRFIRSEYYKNLLATKIQPSQKKRFFGFGQTKKKTSTSSAPNQQMLQQQASQGLTKRRGSDRSLSGSAHELAVSGVKDSRVPHSHSQSNLSDIPYRGDMVTPRKTYYDLVTVAVSSPVKKPSIAIIAGASTSEEVCPWESTVAEHAPATHSRKNSAAHDSNSSSSDLSAAVGEAAAHRVPLTQQHTLDLTCRQLSAAEPPRRASVSVLPPAAAAGAAAHKTGSFEESNSASSVFEGGQEAKGAPMISVSSASSGEMALAPLAEPDSDQSPASEQPRCGFEEEARSNDVCPWEDEEQCKVDAPFVKTYATLGYL